MDFYANLLNYGTLSVCLPFWYNFLYFFIFRPLSFLYHILSKNHRVAEAGQGDKSSGVFDSSAILKFPKIPLKRVQTI